MTCFLLTYNALFFFFFDSLIYFNCIYFIPFRYSFLPLAVHFSFSLTRFPWNICHIEYPHLPFYFFYLGFLSRKFTIYRTAGEGRSYFFKSSLPLPPLHRHLDISRGITAESSPLHIMLSSLYCFSCPLKFHLHFGRVCLFTSSLYPFFLVHTVLEITHTIAVT